MNYVYSLTHFRLLESKKEANICDVKLIGFFSSKEKARKTVEQLKSVSGFKDYPEGFIIEERSIDFDDFDFVGDD